MTIHGRTDDVVMKDVEFYKIPNGMYYPISNKVWTIEGAKEFKERLKVAEVLCDHLRLLEKVRHQMHQEGLHGEIAYLEYMKFHPNYKRL